jgi:N-formylglutamate deformylase
MNLPASRDWLAVHHGNAPLVVSFPHTGIEIPEQIESQLVSPWLGRKDTDFWVDVLYDFAHELGATTIRTALSRTVIDVNRDPSGASLYPGQVTTSLCPLETFDGEPLYKSGCEPGPAEVLRRRAEYYDPYHAALAFELERKRAEFGCVVLYDAHAIRSRVPRLFDGVLPLFNIGTNSGQSCNPALTMAIEKICDAAGFSRVTNGRFRGGWITRRCGNPAVNLHAVQMELAMHGFMKEPTGALDRNNWPTALDDALAARLRIALRDIFDACIAFANARRSNP